MESLPCSCYRWERFDFFFYSTFPFLIITLFEIEIALNLLAHVVSQETSYMKNKASWDIPSDPVVKNLLCNAGGVHLTPGQGTKISPQATGQLSLHPLEPLCQLEKTCVPK